MVLPFLMQLLNDIIMKREKPTISVCIPTYNCLQLLKRCLDPISEGFGDYSYEIVIADGGSTDGTLEYLRELNNVKLIEMGELVGQTKSFNACFRLAEGDYIIPGSDDLIFVPEVYTKLFKLFDEDKEKRIGIIIPKIILKDGHVHSITRMTKRFGVLLDLAFILRASVLRETGYFDERCYSYFIDTDTSLAVLKLGYTSVVTREIGVFHTHTPESRSNEAYLKNRAIILEDVEHGRKKRESHEMKVGEYLRRLSLFKLCAITFFTLCCSVMYDIRLLRPFIKKYNKFANRLYDWFLERVTIFKDGNYDNLEDFFLS